MTRAEKGFTFFWASVTGPQISLASKLTPVPLALLFVLIIHFANPRVSHFSLFPMALSHTVEATLALSARPYTHAHTRVTFLFSWMCRVIDSLTLKRHSTVAHA